MTTKLKVGDVIINANNKYRLIKQKGIDIFDVIGVKSKEIYYDINFSYTPYQLVDDKYKKYLKNICLK